MTVQRGRQRADTHVGNQKCWLYFRKARSSFVKEMQDWLPPPDIHLHWMWIRIFYGVFFNLQSYGTAQRQWKVQTPIHKILELWRTGEHPAFLLFFKLIFTEVELLYNVVVVFTVQWNEPVICIHISCFCSVTKSCPTLWDSVDSSPLVSSVCEIFQARILEWVAISSSRGSSQPRNQTHVSCMACIGRRILYPWTNHLGSLLYTPPPSGLPLQVTTVRQVGSLCCAVCSH